MALTIVTILITLVCVLLVLVVLVQNPKGGGLNSSFGGGASEQMFGVKRTSDFLEKFTLSNPVFEQTQYRTNLTIFDVSGYSEIELVSQHGMKNGFVDLVMN